MANVPKYHQVVPGALVNIVLKADQRTGRQVRGVVQHVLTKGDHHRGIKVRLTDGRVGRVQSMAQGVDTGASTHSSSALTSTSDPNPLPFIDSVPDNAMGPRGRGRPPRHRDVRLEEALDAPAEQIDLAAYIVPSKRKQKGAKAIKANSGEQDNIECGNPSNDYQAAADGTSAIATCPVCEDFEGDEAAVAHHVTAHFEG
ncbi:hypothetical protein F4808DRAFT_311397 [Astrocystis sublimbata]|nr:hypothetical protein F4808DRAFT_311397 [Astrocystis sublimbata]